MKKWQKINLIFFSSIIVFLSSLAYVFNGIDFTSPFGKPWHLQPSVHEDSLSQRLLDKYVILNHQSLFKQLYDSTKTNVFILIDAWGVPTDEKMLDTDFDVFVKLPHWKIIHQRLANRTKHAELVEFRNNLQNKIYLFGGDSLEYNRNRYIHEIGYESVHFCSYCKDATIITKIDSLLENDFHQMIAWTTQSARSGDRDSLRKTLTLIADFAKRHPDIQIVVQGTHRPVLCESKVRNSYKSHWVPAVVLNKKN